MALDLSDGKSWGDRSEEERAALINQHLVADREQLSPELRKVAERWDHEDTVRTQRVV